MPALSHVDLILSTLNATDIGTLDSIEEKMRQVEQALVELDQPALAERAATAVAALRRGELDEFRRARAFLQSKVGHLR